MLNLKSINEVYNSLKSSANKRNIEFTLTKAELWDVDIPITCPVLGIPIIISKGIATDNSPSFDRIDNSKGYTYDNLIIVSNRANRLKSDATLLELKRLYEFYSSLTSSNTTSELPHTEQY